MAPFKEKEVIAALSMMHPLKALGPDGFHVAFFRNYWSTVKDISSLALNLISEW